MPQTIEFEGAQHEFPDDFTPEDISSALASLHPVTPGMEKLGALPKAGQAPNVPMQEQKGPGERFLSSVKSAMNPIPAIQQALSSPSEMQLGQEALHAGAQIRKGRPGRVSADLPSPNPPVLPMGSEPAVQAGGQAQHGDIAGAAGTLTGAYAVPALGVKALPGMIKNAPRVGRALRAGAPELPWPVGPTVKALEKAGEHWKNSAEAPIPGATEFPVPYRGLPESAPQTLRMPPPGAPTPTPLQAGMSPSARLPMPAPGQVAPEPSPLQRGMDPSARIAPPRPRPAKMPPPMPPGSQPLPPSLAEQLPKSAPQRVPMPRPTPEPPAPSELPNVVTSPEIAAPTANAIAVDRPALNRMMHKAGNQAGYDHEAISGIARERFGVSSTTELNERQLLDMYAEFVRESGPKGGPPLRVKATGKPSTLSLEDQLQNSIAATQRRAREAKQISGPVEGENSAQQLGKSIRAALPEEEQ